MSVAGRSHEKTGQPCQDASYCKVLDRGLLIGAVADGAGSASHGDQGARVAARLAVETLADHAAALKASDSDQQWHRLLLAAMGVARGHIEVNAAARNTQARQLATTLILFAAMPEMIVVAQIGDGAVVFRDRAGNVRSLTSPHSGEFINTTTFLVSPDAFKTVQQQIWRGPYTDIAALTDGLQMLALAMPGGEAHAPFFLPLFEFAGKVEDAAHALGDLHDFLRSERIAERVDDDVTLMLAHIAP